MVAACSGLLLLLPLALAVQLDSDRMRRHLLLGCCLLMVIVMVSMLPLIGLVKVGQWSLYMTNLHGLMTAVVFSTLLSLRRSQIDAKAMLETQRLISIQAEAEQARSERDEKERFLAMLTHELRTPLSVIRMVLGSGSADASAERHKQFAHQAVDDINSIFERCLQTDQLERGAIQPRLLPYELQALVQAAVADTRPVSAWNCRLNPRCPSSRPTR
jgi:signal transduction histidine kinase